MIFGSALVWLPVTLLTAPVDPDKLDDFYRRVTPPGFWGPSAKRVIHVKAIRDENRHEWLTSLKLWAIATTALFTTTIGPLQWMLGKPLSGMSLCAVSALLWIYVGRNLKHFGTDSTA